MRSVLAYHEAFRGVSRSHCLDLARRALRDGWLLRRSTELIWILHVAVAFTYAGEYEQSARVLDEALTDARRRGDPLLVVLLLRQRGLISAHRGDLLAAEEDLRSSEIGPDLGAVDSPLHYAGHLADVLLDRGELQEATRLLATVPGGDQPHAGAQLAIVHVRGRLQLESGAPEAALDEYRTLGAAMDALGIRNPAGLPWRSQAALALGGSIARKRRPSSLARNSSWPASGGRRGRSG